MSVMAADVTVSDPFLGEDQPQMKHGNENIPELLVFRHFPGLRDGLRH